MVDSSRFRLLDFVERAQNYRIEDEGVLRHQKF